MFYQYCSVCQKQFKFKLKCNEHYQTYYIMSKYEMYVQAWLSAKD